MSTMEGGMNSADQFFTWCWKIGGAVLTVLILSASSCSMYDSYVLMEALKGGGDPLRIKCAMSSNSSSLHFCTVLATKDVQP
jgi:hypothetical protein